MKILHVNTESGWRGGENQILLLLKGLANLPNVENHAALLQGSEAEQRLAPFAMVQPIKQGLTRGLNPDTVMRLAAYCRRENIQVIDAHSSKGHTLALAIKMLYPRVKLVVHRRVDNVPGHDPINNWKYRTKKVDRYIAISEAIKEVLINSGVNPDRIDVVHSAVPPHDTTSDERAESRRSLRATFRVPDDHALFGNASAISHQKGYDVLLRSCARLQDRGVKFRCLIAGDGPQKSEIQALAGDLGLTSVVTFLGFVKDIRPFLQGLDFFVLPSANEGLGTILLEATYAGLPIIATKVGGIPEIIEHMITGLLLPPGDEDILAQHIGTYIKDPLLAATLQRACREKVLRDFSIEAMVQGNLRIYRDLTGGGRP